MASSSNDPLAQTITLEVYSRAAERTAGSKLQFPLDLAQPLGTVGTQDYVLKVTRENLVKLAHEILSSHDEAFFSQTLIKVEVGYIEQKTTDDKPTLALKLQAAGDDGQYFVFQTDEKALLELASEISKTFDKHK